MKSIFKKIIAIKLKFLAKRMLKKHKPEIIAITGSVGKTTTKQAVGLVLKSKFKSLVPEKSYNTEIGVPLAIFDEAVPANLFSVFSWVKIVLQCVKKLLSEQDYYEKILLEMGADKPGDIKYLTSFAKPHISIITAIGSVPAHIGAFENKEQVIQEKSNLVKILSQNDYAILNFDDPDVGEMAKFTKAKIISYGINNDAEIKAFNIETNLSGTSFNLYCKNQTVNMNIKVLGNHMIYPVLAATAVGIIYGMNLTEISKILSEFHAVSGRMNILEGIRGSTIIDDSYNSNPTSAIAALKTISKIEAKRKILVLGNMNELGKLEERGHRIVGEYAANVGNILITVGDKAKEYLADEAIKKGFPESQIHSFKNSVDAGKFLKSFIEKGDLILLKGSQNNVRLEWVAEQIMADPQKAKGLLVRQGTEWDRPKDLL